MVAVRVVQMAADEVVDVVAVRHRGMAAAIAMDVSSVVAVAVVIRGTARGMLVVDGDRMLVDVVPVGVVHMPVMQVVDMTFVGHRDVPAVRAVLMGVVGMDRVVGHCAGLSERGAIRQLAGSEKHAWHRRRSEPADRREPGAVVAAVHRA